MYICVHTLRTTCFNVQFPLHVGNFDIIHGDNCDQIRNTFRQFLTLPANTGDKLMYPIASSGNIFPCASPNGTNADINLRMNAHTVTRFQPVTLQKPDTVPTTSTQTVNGAYTDGI